MELDEEFFFKNRKTKCFVCLLLGLSATLVRLFDSQDRLNELRVEGTTTTWKQQREVAMHWSVL